MALSKEEKFDLAGDLQAALWGAVESTLRPFDREDVSAIGPSLMTATAHLAAECAVDLGIDLDSLLKGVRLAYIQAVAHRVSTSAITTAMDSSRQQGRGPGA